MDDVLRGCDILEYAMYKGENLLVIGTESELARELGVKVETIKFYRSHAYQRRLAKRKKRGENCRVIVELD